MDVRRAQPEDAAALTAIAHAAKRHWGYPERWIEQWNLALTVRPESVVRNDTFAACIEGEPVGFYALRYEPDRAEMEHLWVLPEAMGRGIGRALFLHAIERVRSRGFKALKIESDPNAAEFYERLGARRVGTNVTEVDGQRRELPVFVYSVEVSRSASSEDGSGSWICEQ